MEIIQEIKTKRFSVKFVVPPVAQVRLLTMTEDPMLTIGLVSRGYAGRYDLNYEDHEVDDMVAEIQKTELQTPLRFVSMTFLINNVTRAFTHQMVRYQVGASFVQESMRFVDKRDAMVLVSPTVAHDPTLLSEFVESTGDVFSNYASALESGVAVQDARGMLPHHVLTNLWVNLNLSTLAHIYWQRHCCQAQHLEWLTVVDQMKAALPEPLQAMLHKPWETGAVTCGFGASFDRPCKFQKAFDRNVGDLLEKRGIVAVMVKDGGTVIPNQLAETLERIHNGDVVTGPQLF